MNRLALSLIALFLLICDASAANRFLTCNTACTITASDTTIWGTTTGGTGASVPTTTDAVILDGATCVGGTTCTATMGAGYNPTWQSITMGACTASTTGCIFDNSVNNSNITLTASAGFSGTGAGVRTVKLGTATYTISANAGNWSFTTTTNLTYTGTSANIIFTGTTSSRTFSGGGLSHGNVTFGASSGGGTYTVAGANTFASLSITAPNYVIFPNGVTNTITNAISWAGSSNSQVGVVSSITNSVTTIAVAAGSTASWFSFRDITFTGSPVATNSFNLLNNSGITITGPAASGPNIIGGWLLEPDLPANDNFMALWENAA